MIKLAAPVTMGSDDALLYHTSLTDSFHHQRRQAEGDEGERWTVSGPKGTWGEPGVTPQCSRLWRIVLAAALLLSLLLGALLDRAFDGSGLAGPLGVVRQAPLADGGEQVWSGRTKGGVVPVGWAHSQAGAIAAATSYTVALSSSEVLFDPAKRRLAIDAIAAPEARVRLQRELDATADTVAVALTRGPPADNAAATLDPARVIFQAVPVRYRVDLYDSSHARIAIWMTGVAGYQPSGLPVQEAWGVTTVQLRWVHTDWKETSATVQDGPTPVADGTPPTPTPVLVREAQRFKEYRYAVGQ